MRQLWIWSFTRSFLCFYHFSTRFLFVWLWIVHEIVLVLRIFQMSRLCNSCVKGRSCPSYISNDYVVIRVASKYRCRMSNGERYAEMWWILCVQVKFRWFWGAGCCASQYRTEVLTCTATCTSKLTQNLLLATAVVFFCFGFWLFDRAPTRVLLFNKPTFLVSSKKNYALHLTHSIQRRMIEWRSCT